MQKSSQWHPNKIHWKKRIFFLPFIKPLQSFIKKVKKFLYKRYLVDPAKEAHFGHRLSHASVSSGNETANSSLIRSESI